MNQWLVVRYELSAIINPPYAKIRESNEAISKLPGGCWLSFALAT
jgi:hypothetical protein